MILKRSLVIAVGLFIAMLMAACGSPTPATPNGSGPYGSGNTNPPATTTPTTGGGTAAVIQTATASVKGVSRR